MDISGLSPSLLASTQAPASQKQGRSADVLPVEPVAPVDRQAPSLATLRQGIRAAISAAFRLRFASLPAYADIDRRDLLFRRNLAHRVGIQLQPFVVQICRRNTLNILVGDRCLYRDADGDGEPGV